MDRDPVCLLDTLGSARAIRSDSRAPRAEFPPVTVSRSKSWARRPEGCRAFRESRSGRGSGERNRCRMAYDEIDMDRGKPMDPGTRTSGPPAVDSGRHRLADRKPLPALAPAPRFDPLRPIRDLPAPGKPPPPSFGEQRWAKRATCCGSWPTSCAGTICPATATPICTRPISTGWPGAGSGSPTPTCSRRSAARRACRPIPGAIAARTG